MARNRRKGNRTWLKLLVLVFLIAVTAGGFRVWGSIQLAGTLKSLRDDGYVLRPSAFNAPQVDDNDNAALLILKACQWSRNHPEESRTLAGTHRLATGLLWDWGSDDIEQARVASEAYQPAIDLIVRAADEPKSRFPIDYSKPEDLPDLEGAGKVFRATLLEAKWRLVRADTGRAVSGLVASGRMLSAIGAERAYPYRVLAVTLFPEYYRALEDLCREGQVSTTDLESLAKTLDALKACNLKGSLELDMALMASEWKNEGSHSRNPFLWPILPWDMRYALDRRVRYLDALALTGSQRTAAVYALRKERFPDWAAKSPRLLTDAESRYEEFQKLEVGIGLAEAGLACTHYRMVHQRWPRYLAVAFKEAGLEEPLDPMTGKAFVAVAEEDVFSIASPGFDAQDDSDDLGFVIASNPRFR